MNRIHPRNHGRQSVRRAAWRVLFTVTMTCATLAGCGGDDDEPVADTVPGTLAPASDGAATPAMPPASASASASSDDGASARQVPVVAAPATGTCGESGTAVVPDRVLNSTLDCAP